MLDYACGQRIRADAAASPLTRTSTVLIHMFCMCCLHLDTCHDMWFHVFDSLSHPTPRRVAIVANATMALMALMAVLAGYAGEHNIMRCVYVIHIRYMLYA